MKLNLMNIIIIIIVVILLIAGVYTFASKRNVSSTTSNTGVTHENDISIKDYDISVHAEESGNPNSDAYFTTAFTYIDSEGTSNNYFVDYYDIYLVSENIDEEPNFETSDQGYITVNDKEFKYYVDSTLWNAVLYYTLPDENGTLVINLRGGNVYDSNGSQANTLACVDDEVLVSKELADALNFSVNQ